MTGIIVGGIIALLLVIFGLISLRIVSAGTRQKDINLERARRVRMGSTLDKISDVLYGYQGQLDDVGNAMAITIRDELTKAREDLLKLENK